VIEANAIPVFADIDVNTFNIDPKRSNPPSRRAPKPSSPSISAGQIADMDAIMAIAKEHRLTVVEDAAHAHGASYQGRPPAPSATWAPSPSNRAKISPPAKVASHNQ